MQGNPAQQLDPVPSHLLWDFQRFCVIQHSVSFNIIASVVRARVWISCRLSQAGCPEQYHVLLSPGPAVIGYGARAVLNK